MTQYDEAAINTNTVSYHRVLIRNVAFRVRKVTQIWVQRLQRDGWSKLGTNRFMDKATSEEEWG
jgi:hypothetical protein